MIDPSLLTHVLLTGVSTVHLSSLVAELARPWVVGVEGRRHQVRGGARKRAPGAGARHQLVFVDRLVATLIRLRHDLAHAVLAVLYEVDRSTITPGAIAPFDELRKRQRHDHSWGRTTVEHALADHKRWKHLQRWTHRLDRLPDTYRAIASLVSDRTAVI
ncbi:hypothetical protein ACIPN8_42710 [Streptomyces sp. NPDC086082]|uniref:hypothetical protein n=1 Tax=Streptomyces sp. NPDC086082 TaxID=3365750 RepID=UPI00380592F4